MSIGKLTRYGLPYSNVVANGIATNNITPGRTLECMTLKLGGEALEKSMIPLVKVKANGKVIMEASGTELAAMDRYRGLDVDDAFLDLNFSDVSMNSEFDRMVSAFDTSAGIANITTEVTIAGATAPVLTPILQESATQKRSDGRAEAYAPVFRKVLRYPFNIATGGRLPVTVPFGRQNGAIIKRLHVFHSGSMTGAVVKMDGLVVHESVAAENAYFQVKHGRVPQENVYTLDFVADGNITKALDTRSARSLEWLFDFEAADAGSVIVEYLDTLGNL